MTALDRPIGEDLRDIRRGFGWSLAQVEAKSQGRFAMPAVGSWERAHRHPTVDKARALLDWYGGWRLTVLAPGDIVHTGRVTEGAGLRYSVVCNGLIIPANDRVHAEHIAAMMPGARIGYQLVGAMSYLDGGS